MIILDEERQKWARMRDIHELRLELKRGLLAEMPGTLLHRILLQQLNCLDHDSDHAQDEWLNALLRKNRN